MSDRQAPASFTLGELAKRVDGELVGDPELRITGLRAVEHAAAGDLSFLSHAAYRDAARRSPAAALLVAPEMRGEDLPQALLVVASPALALAKLIGLFHPEEPPVPGVHPTAVVGQGCALADGVSVGPYAVLGDGVAVGAGSRIGAHAVLGRRCQLGAGVTLYPHVVLYDGTELGDRVTLHAGTVIGADGFGYVFHGGEHVKVPQVGRTVIEADVEIGALSAVDRALLEATRIGSGSKIDNLVQVGHNVEIGRGCILCGQVGLAGSARLGDGVVLGGQSGAAGHLELGDGVQVAGKSAVFESVPAGRKVGGIPAIDLSRWRRQVALLSRLGEIWKRLRSLERSATAGSPNVELPEDGER